MSRFSVSLLELDCLNLGAEIEALARAGVDSLHIDICDSHFASVPGLPLSHAARVIEAFGLPVEMHLLVQDPRRIFEVLPDDASVMPRVALHYEACRHLHGDLVRLRQLGFSPGIALNPATALEYIEYVIEEVDFVLILGVNPGYPRQKLLPQTISKISRLRAWRDRLQNPLQIVVEGNVTLENVHDLVAAGVDQAVLGGAALHDTQLPIDSRLRQFQDTLIQRHASSAG